jgi:hypothetical protein
MEIDYEHGALRMDWHGYTPDQVETWSDRLLEAAYLHGFVQVEFVHGAADVAARGTPGFGGEHVRGRGRIKDMLRQRLYGNRWRRWALERREGRHRIEESRMVIALRENPRPKRDARWPVLPPPAH